ncbi:MAG: hypothetical protein R1F54_01190 [Candidatus Zeuxoniibacter abyssi]|nr:MAG: hypothetical protein R1F54_01190 [Candidatus Persebacteraceae bacterium AB1(2)]
MTAIALITTTINVPHLLTDYARDAKAHGRELKFMSQATEKPRRRRLIFAPLFPDKPIFHVNIWMLIRKTNLCKTIRF